MSTLTNLEFFNGWKWLAYSTGVRGVCSVDDNCLDEWILEFDRVGELFAYQAAHCRQEHQRTESEYAEPDTREHDVEKGEPTVGVLGVADRVSMDTVPKPAVISETCVTIAVVMDYFIADSFFTTECYLCTYTSTDPNTDT